MASAIPLSKKSRYVLPHLRADKKDVIVVNPEDEMPPPPQKQRAPPAYPRGPHQRSPQMQGGMPMPYPNYPPPHMLPLGPPPPNGAHPGHHANVLSALASSLAKSMF